MRSALRGCSSQAMRRSVLTPERLSDEHRLIAQTAREFVEQGSRAEHRTPRAEGLGACARSCSSAAGELGLLGVDAPEEFGGVGLDKAAALVVSSHIAGSASFSATFGAQSNLAHQLPILYFGTADQKSTLSAEADFRRTDRRVRAHRTALGFRCARRKCTGRRGGRRRYFLNGQKMWITNGGFADVFTVFAKVDGEQFTAFSSNAGRA